MTQMATRRQSSLLASKRIQSQLESSDEATGHTGKVRAKPSSRTLPAKRVSTQESNASGADDTVQPPASRRPVKRLRREKSATKPTLALDLHRRLFSTTVPPSVDCLALPCALPLRQHDVNYHRPLLLHGELGKRGRSALLAWYGEVNTNRSMPWRKAFIDPKDYGDAAKLRQALTQRAYEVFISEIMLQQTRVKTVIEYWNRWMERWPTIYDLAKADEDDVMSAWRGLGYYSRCKRILEACRKIVGHKDWQGLMPQDAKELEAHIPGVGPYTAGAISSIVFGRPAPMVDGNVLRVLSRQLGLLADTKTDKGTIDIIWACARSLVETVALENTLEAADTGGAQPNDAPGRWGQALMDLGSTICTPSPNCSACPATTTCRAYSEGRALAASRGLLGSSPVKSPEPLDIEDTCHLCEPHGVIPVVEAPGKAVTKKPKQMTVSSFFVPSSKKPSKADENDSADISPEALKVIVSHAQKFPVRIAKKALREEETLVCAVRRAGDGLYLLQKRPEKGTSPSSSMNQVAKSLQVSSRACGNSRAIFFQGPITVPSALEKRRPMTLSKVSSAWKTTLPQNACNLWISSMSESLAACPGFSRTSNWQCMSIFSTSITQRRCLWPRILIYAAGQDQKRSRQRRWGLECANVGN